MDRDPKSLFGLAAVDISTGAFDVYVTEAGALGALLARLEPREIVASDVLLQDTSLVDRLGECGAAITPLNERAFFGRAAEKRLLDYYRLGTLDGLGTLSRLEIDAAGLCLAYIEKTQFAAKPRLNRPTRVETRANLEIDAATRINLELVRSQSGQRQGTSAFRRWIARSHPPGPEPWPNGSPRRCATSKRSRCARTPSPFSSTNRSCAPTFGRNCARRRT